MLTRACTLALVLLAFAGDAAASELIGRDGGRASLQVNGAGQAHVAWSEDGATRHLVAGNAINARPPRPGIPQVSFQLRYGARAIAGAGCGPLRRAAARLAGRRLQGAGRLLLGAAALGTR